MSQKIKNCEQCGKEFETSILTKRFCNEKCRYTNANGTIFIKETCLFCKKIFEAGKFQKRKFCSVECRKDYNKQVLRKNNPLVFELPSGTVGAIGELRICVDLLTRGYHVYRSVSPSCPTDLAIMHQGKLYGIEVVTGYVSLKGKLCHNKIYIKNPQFDIVAIVLKNGDITYEPPLPL